VALLLAAAGAGIEREALERAYPRVGEVPFDSHRKMMTTVHRAEAGFVVCTKGAPEAVERIRRSGEEREAAAFGVRARELADAGYRVLAVGTARLDNLPADIGDAEKEIHVIGLIAIADPPKERARGTIEECKRAGIVPVLITGDHAATAVAIANRVGIIDDGDAEVATGDQLRAGTIADIAKIRVFARTSPDQKPDIVEAWQRNEAVVAMVGDGVNDGPALRRADIGVAMGRHGTEVARQAADLVLANDDLETVVVAVEEGRRIYSNVRRFLTFGLAGGTAEILVMLFGPAVGFAVPLLAAQILWINLLTHGLTGVALGAEPVDPGTMRRGPRPPKESVLGDGLLARVVRLAIVATVATLAVALWAKGTDRPWQTVVFVTLTMLQLGVALGLRARRGGRANPFLLVAVVVSYGLALAGVYVPALRDLLGTTTLSVLEVVVATAIGAVGWAATRIDLRLFTRRTANPGRGLAE
jgi:P-type Ca2+ transporter type 2C